MSAIQILEELPKLTPEERRAISLRLRELEAKQEEMEWLETAARRAFQEIDRMEDEHAKRRGR